mgnify:CR=1 FL=1
MAATCRKRWAITLQAHTPCHQRHRPLLKPLGRRRLVKKSSFLYYTREALGEVAPRIADFAEREGLHAHARSVTIRYESEDLNHE